MKQRKRRAALRVQGLPVDTEASWFSRVGFLFFRLSLSLLPVLAAMPSRKKCPLDKYCRPKLCAILSDIVPFPDPGGPMIAARNNFAMSPTKKIKIKNTNQSEQKPRMLRCMIPLLVRELSSSRPAHMNGNKKKTTQLVKSPVQIFLRVSGGLFFYARPLSLQARIWNLLPLKPE